MGCGGAIAAVDDGQFGDGSGPIGMSYVACSGNEKSLKECPHHQRSWFCDLFSVPDAGVVCERKSTCLVMHCK